MKKLFTPSFEIAGTSLGFAIIGEALGSQPLKDAGTAASKFIVPSVNIGAGGYVMDQLRSLSQSKRGNSNGKKEEKKKISLFL